MRSRVIYRGNIAFLVAVVENRCNCRRNFKCPLYSRQSAHTHTHTYNVYVKYRYSVRGDRQTEKKSDVMSVATTVAVGVTSTEARVLNGRLQPRQNDIYSHELCVRLSARAHAYYTRLIHGIGRNTTVVRLKYTKGRYCNNISKRLYEYSSMCVCRYKQ